MNGRLIYGITAMLLALSPAARGDEVKPLAHYGRIAQRLADTLPRYHVSQHKLDDEISQRAWTNLVTFYDFDHSVFLASDLARLSAHEKTIDDELRGGDVSFGFDVHNLYVARLHERLLFATNLLARGGWDFATNETYRIRRKDAPWPETVADAEEHWRKRIKNEVLAQYVGAELDGKTNTAEVAENLVKKYRQYAAVLTEPDEEAVLQHYLSAVARAYDPHTDYMSPMSKEDFDMDMNLSLCGVGAVLSMDEGALKIVEIMPGGPVDRDGRIKTGDKIVGVKQGDGPVEDIMWQPMRKTIRKIRGPKGTRVTLEIIPRKDPTGATKKHIELVRDEIKLEDQAATGRVERVCLNGVTNRLGYIDLPGFYGTMDKRPNEPGFRSCAMDVSRYLAEFNAQDVQGLVLDLRGNGGGSLREAVMLSALFVPSGPVVQIRDIRTVGALPIPSGNPVAFKRPVVVLTDRASASASEIVAGHLQDVDRAIILGDTRTHGKGTVQTVMGMGPDKYGSTKITTARFYRVNGRSTQVEGVAADIRLPSLLDSLDIGEDKLTYALPFSRILPADYANAWNLRSHLAPLRAASEARLKDDARYTKHLAHVAGMRAIADREEVPLEYAARLAMMKADRELNEGEDEELGEDGLPEEDDGDEADAAEGEDATAKAEEPAKSGADAEKDGEDDEDDKPKGRRRRNRKPERADDIVLEEALRILADLVRLNGTAELPVRTEWEW